jgi:putative acetyltransferase
MAANTRITAERPDTADATMLIAELDAYLEGLYPQVIRHAQSMEQLLTAGVAFFVLRANGTPAGCGGVRLHSTAYGEIKRLYVRPEFRGQGFATLLLTHLADHACARGAGLLRLETGIRQVEGIHLYERMGFRRIPAFGEFRDHSHPLSLYYEKRIA